jgi:translation initiation factor 1A
MEFSFSFTHGGCGDPGSVTSGCLGMWGSIAGAGYFYNLSGQTSFSRGAGRPGTWANGVDVLTDKRPGQGEAPEEIVRVRLPNKRNREIFACAELMMGANHIRVRCFDGITRMGRIKGKIKKRVWIREGDILLVVPWSFQDSKCDIVYRYTGPQVEWLRRNGYL